MGSTIEKWAADLAKIPEHIPAPDKKEPDFNKPVDVCAFLFSELHFCGCFEFDETVAELKRVLLWADTSPDRASYEKLYPGNIGVFYLVCALLDDAGILEHGTSIRYPFLTSRGRDLFTALNRFSVEELEAPDGEAYDGLQYN